MESRETKKSKQSTKWTIRAILSVAIWLSLIILKERGALEMSWTAVLLSIVWVPALTYLVASVLAFILVEALELAENIKRRRRKRKENRRIIDQARAFGVWDKPQSLGGKALELSAWEHHKIKRKRGESDADLRRRCMMRADIEKFKAKQEGEKANV